MNPGGGVEPLGDPLKTDEDGDFLAGDSLRLDSGTVSAVDQVSCVGRDGWVNDLVGEGVVLSEAETLAFLALAVAFLMTWELSSRNMRSTRFR